MKKILIIALIVLAAIAVAFFAFNSYIYTEKQGDAGTVFADYAYSCEDGTELTLNLGGDLSSARISSATNPDVVPPTELVAVEAPSGARFDGGGFVVIGQGESVAFSGPGFKTMCQPVPSDDGAPFNFGD